MRGYALPAEADERRVTAATDPDAAFDALYRAYAPTLRAYCRARLRNPADAEDACHEAILRAFNALPRFDTERPLWPWLATIAGNVCRDMQRRQVTAAAHVTYVDGAVDDLDELAAARARRAILADALQSMPERYRSHVYLRDLEGWSYEAIASYDGSSVASVRSTLHRARSVLRKRVRDTAERRHEWPMPALVPLVFSRLRARIARARTTAAPVAESFGRASGFDSLLALVAQPAFAQAVLSLAAVVGIGLGVATDAYASQGDRTVTITTANASSSSDAPVSPFWGGAYSRSAATNDTDSVAQAPASLADVAAPSDPGDVVSPDVAAPSTPSAPSLPTVGAPSPTTPPPPVQMTSSPEVNTSIDGPSPSADVTLPDATVTLPSGPQPIDPGGVTADPGACTDPGGGMLSDVVCSGEVPQAPTTPDQPSVEGSDPEALLTA